MLSVRLICVGKLGEKFWADAVKEYTKRLGAYCKLEIIELPEQQHYGDRRNLFFRHAVSRFTCGTCRLPRY